MGDSAMIFRVRWWIRTYEDTRKMYHRVNTALQRALDANGIESPPPTVAAQLSLEQGFVDDVSYALPGEEPGRRGLSEKDGPVRAD